MKTIGNEQISAWAVAENVCWIQTSDRKLAAKLARLHGARLVATGVIYLRAYELPRSLSWVKRNLIEHGDRQRRRP
jgi:hypothetical protein